MNKYLFSCIFLFLSNSCFAENVYKWTDEFGKVHFGDSNNAPKSSTQIIINTPEASSVQPLVTKIAENKSIPESTGNPVDIDAGNLKKCLAMAREMEDKKDLTPTYIRAQSKKLLDLCPNTSYQCVTFKSRPQSNNCKAVPFLANGHITENKIYDR